MTTTFVVFLSICLGAIAANTSQIRNLSAGNGKTDGKVVVHQICNSAATTAEITSLKKEVETMRKELTQRLDKMNSKDSWIKLNTVPVCFGTRDGDFGRFTAPSGGKLASVKLVHLYGYVTCDTNIAASWSYWGCSNNHKGVKDYVNVAITTSANQILLPSSQFMTHGYGSIKWALVPGYNSFSPELVMSAFSNPLSVTKGQELRLWYGEDLVNISEDDNAGKACCDVYARFI